MAPQMSFIGLGQMGMAISENIFHDGKIQKPLVLYNRTTAKAHEHSERLGGCEVADSIAAAVAPADIVWLCLQDRDAVEEVFAEILLTPIKGKLFVDSSTISPEATNSIAERAFREGGEFVALPVMGAPPLAVKRSLICIASGKPESVDRIRPFLEGVTAELLKLMGNFLIMATIETVAEVNVFAEKCKIGTANMNKLLSAMFPEPPHALYNRQMLTGEYCSGNAIVGASKALQLASEVMGLANECGASVKIYETAVENLKAAEAHAGPDVDITGIYGAITRGGFATEDDDKKE
ncbi:6-phosphogluconate dehydrogenase-like protein [Penicillium chermesinum]|nr:6-phosphogluconate dehydrogenase-like protein [Penicillium chermesinum]